MIINCKNRDIPYLEHSEIFSAYLNEVRRYGTLSRSEEKELLIMAQQKDDIKKRNYAIDRLVGCNQLFVLSVAKKLATSNNVLDLINEGNIGLMEAIQRFDTNKSIHFITYAVFWIRKQINEYLSENGNVVRQSNYGKIRRYCAAIQKEFMNNYQRMPQLDEMRDLIKERFNFNVTDVTDLEMCHSVPIESNFDDDEQSLADYGAMFNSVTAENNVDEYINSNDTSETVKRILDTLTEKEKYVVKCFYGLEDGIEMPVRMIADRMDISEERVRQLVSKTMEKMKKIGYKK